MEINASTLSVFHISRFLALVPVSIRRNAKGDIEIRRNMLLSIYSLVLSLCMVILVYYNKFSICEYSLRKRSPPLKLISLLDVALMVASNIAAIGCGLWGIKSTQEFNAQLRKVDATLHSLSNINYDHKINRIIAAISILICGALIGFDISMWILPDLGKGKETCIFIRSVSYVHQILKIGFHSLHATVVLGLTRRFRRLNAMLNNNYLSDTNIDGVMNMRRNSIKITTESSLSLHDASVHLDTKSFSEENLGADLMKSLSDNHKSLGNCVKIFSDTYGIAVLLILTSVMLKLVRNVFIIVLALLTENSTDFAYDQTVWLIFNLIRLVLFVEPCNMATEEFKKTVDIICEIKRKTDEPLLSLEVEQFWQHLLISKIEISAFGFCGVNRQLLATLAFWIATNIALLIQLQDLESD